MNNNFFPPGYGLNRAYEEPSILELLMERYDISVSTLAAVLGCSQLAVWRWQKLGKPIPPPHERTLKKFLEHLEKR